MVITVEISYYPLLEDYKTTILQFIGRLQEYEQITIRANSLSTQIVGEYDLVMSILTKEMKASFTEDQMSVMVLKILNKAVELKYRV